MFRVEYSTAAARQLRKLGPNVQDRIRKTVEILREQPRPPKAMKMSGRDNQWRVRTGDYRIIYEIRDEQLLILVVNVGHRRDTY